MGKATIISEVQDGQYLVEMKYAGRAENEAKIATLTASIVKLQAEYDIMPETTADEIWDKRIKGLQIKSLEKQVEYLQDYFPADPQFNAFCVDRTTGLTGNVGLIEVPGEFEGAAKANIRAGYSGDAAWDVDRDGQLWPPIATGPWTTFLNKSMLTGWQKFLPLYRFGIIVADSLDFVNNTCDVCLDSEYSSQLNLPVNQNQTFAECSQVSIPQMDDFCAANPAHET